MDHGLRRMQRLRSNRGAGSGDQEGVVNRAPNLSSLLSLALPTHNGQRRGTWPVVSLYLGWLVGVRGLCRRELGRLNDEVLDEVLALRAASRGFCR